MAIQPQFKQPPASVQSLPSAITDELFNLAASRNLDVMLNQALRMTMGILSAEAGSLYFHNQSSKSIQFGAFRPETLARIQYWETELSRKLQDSTCRVSSHTSSPISVSKLNSSRLVLVNTPLLQNDIIVGLLSFVLPPNSNLSIEQRAVLTRIAANLGQIASILADLDTANRRLQRISVFYDVGQALVTTFDITKLLSDTMALAVNLIDAGAASIMLVDEDSNELIFKVSHGSGNHLVRQQRIPLDEGIAGWVVKNGKPVVANDARADARFSHRVDVRTGFLTQSIAAVPLRAKGRIIGVLEVLNKYSGAGFNQDDMQLMSFIATQATIAIENARLYDQVCQERDQILRAQDIAFHEITRNLHDGTLQLLSAISLSLDHLELLSAKAPPEAVQNQIGAIKNMVHQATGNTRNLLFEMRPSILETQGLIAACKHYINQLRDITNFNIHFVAPEQVTYSPRITGHIFSIVQETINNVRRHANAANVWLTMEFYQNQFILIIRDDGTGFDVTWLDQNKPQHNKLGFVKMRERAAAINAKLLIESQTQLPNRGTAIQLIIPAPVAEK